jgi:uncharacterized protein YbjT (DUF2867 family)
MAGAAVMRAGHVHLSRSLRGWDDGVSLSLFLSNRMVASLLAAFDGVERCSFTDNRAASWPRRKTSAMNRFRRNRRPHDRTRRKRVPASGLTPDPAPHAQGRAWR